MVALTVLFADISGSTQLYDTMGDRVAKAIVEECLDLLMEVVQQGQGRVIKTIGDEIMATFPVSDRAFEAACCMQDRLTQYFAIHQNPLGLRVGFNMGPVIEEGGDIFGDAVNVASRMVNLAKAGQVITTRETAETLSPSLQNQTRQIDRLMVKGKRDTIDVYEVIWQREGLTIARQPWQYAPSLEAVLKLYFHQETLHLAPDGPAFTLGRDPQNDLVVVDDLASRYHARIEYRKGKFIFSDQSTNGSFIWTPETQQVFLHREEFHLQTQGYISLGETHSPDHPEVVRFEFMPAQGGS